ncbi:UNVERIFIED_CONTAM: putative membrane-bound dolichyl-phosphate-mannose-protein mannosyltransferase [Acetivibrio alkalicellulosi]
MSKKNLLNCLLLVLILQFAFCSNVFAQNENLVMNPTFDEGNQDELYFWSKLPWYSDEGVTEFIIDENTSFKGSRSVCIINNSPNDARYTQTIAVKGDTLYRFSSWIKTENVGSDGLGANLSIYNLPHLSRDIKGTSENWEYVEFYGQTSPNQDTVLLTLALGGHGDQNFNTGKAWFDNVEVVEVDALPVGTTAINLDRHYTPQSNSTDDNSNTNLFFISLIILVFLIIISIILFFFIKAKKDINNGTSKKTNVNKTITKKASAKQTALSNGWELYKVKFDKKDLLIMSIMSLVYLMIALYNLGGFKAPSTFWQPTLPGENFTIDLGKDTTLSRVYYFSGIGEVNFKVEYLNENGDFTHLTTVRKDHMRDVFKWDYVTVAPITTNRLKFTYEGIRMTLNEIAIVEAGSTEPLTGITIVDKNVHARSSGSVENLFDEPDTFAYRPSFMNSMYFDEIYHGRTAYEHIHKIPPYENTHPPLGKVFIALGVLIFGMVPFGWRIMGTLFGVAMIPAMYTFGKKVFDNRFYAFCSAFLMMFDLMHFAQTRISTIDSYVTFFVILMYYHMYDYSVNKSYSLGFKPSLKPLFLSGLFFGFGAASKWIAFYGAAGLALLFFITKAVEYADYWKLSDKRSKKPDWYYDYNRLYLFGTMGLCVVFFVIIPTIIYSLSYIPWIMVPNVSGFRIVIDNFKSMLSYHSLLQDDHPYSSTWWEWPFMIRPMAFYFGRDLPSGVVSKIYTIGNPAVWWTGIAAVLAIASMALTKVKKHAVLIFILSISAFAFISLPKTFVPSEVWIVMFFILTVFILILTNFNKSIIITAIASSAVFSLVVIGFMNVDKNYNYYKSGNTQFFMWVFLLTSISILLVGLYKFERKIFPIIVAMIFQYIPWVGVPRSTFIYHYFTILPFLILCIVYVIKKITEKWSDFKYFSYIYLALVLAIFIMFYPIVSGMQINASYLKNLNWFNWRF